MVTRDFRCPTCGSEFEKMTEYGERPMCPHCSCTAEIVYKKFPAFKIRGFSEVNGYASGATKEQRAKMRAEKDKCAPCLDISEPGKDGFREVRPE